MFRLLALTLLLLSSAASWAGDWKDLGERDGVRTWSREVPDSKLLGFRGESVVDVPVLKLLGTMLDHARAPEWVDLLTEHRVLAPGVSQEVIYQRYGMTWPVADRDMVIRRTVQTNPELRSTTVLIESTTHPDAPLVAGVVRAQVSQTWFNFTELPDGRTRVEVQAFTDPKGIVPGWLVNVVQKTWARNSINALARCAGTTPAPSESRRR